MSLIFPSAKHFLLLLCLVIAGNVYTVMPGQAQPLIVIDPDTTRAAGVSGSQPTVEKTPSFRFAERLAADLRQRGGYRILLTDGADLSGGGRGRIDRARKSGASLFVSVQVALSGSSRDTVRLLKLSDEAADRISQEAIVQGRDSELVLKQAPPGISRFDPIVHGVLIELARRWIRQNKSRTDLLTETLSSYLSARKADIDIVTTDLGELKSALFPAVRIEFTIRDEEKLSVFSGSILGAVTEYFQRLETLSAPSEVR